MLTHTIREGMPAAEYHAAPGLSATVLKKLNISPAHVMIPREEVSAASQRAMDIGTIAHAQVLEGNINLPAMGFVMRPDGMSFVTKEGKAWKLEQEAANLRPIAAEDVALALTVAAAVIDDEDGFASVNGAGNIPELSLFSDYHGQAVKARLDMYDPRAFRIVDLKTCQSAEPDAFARDCEARGYLLQAAHYLNVARLCGLAADSFRFIAASTNAPYEVAVYDFDDHHPAWEAVNARLHELYDLHAKCVRLNKWPKRRWPASEIGVPAFSKFNPKTK